MPPRHALPLVLLAACELHGHRRASSDGGPAPGAPDAASFADALPPAPAGCAWKRTSVNVLGGTLLETRPVTVGRAARIRIDVEQCPGDIAGATGYGWTLENEYLVIDASVWRAGPDCDEPEVVTRDVAVDFAYEGTWTFLTEEITVGPTPGGACGSDPVSACERDCDCPDGERCLSGAGDVHRCAQPCELSRECGGDGRCGDGDGLTGVCLREVDECDGDHACPAGFACDGGGCQPTFTLSGATRHDCDCDDDCDTGMRCVEHPPTVDSGVTRRCEALCLTPSDVWCQGPHTCNAQASIEYDFGVCAWVGD
jgi:hypothetical protein